MTGETYIAPVPVFRSNTHFSSAYGLVGYEVGEWRVAGRFDRFYNSQDNTGKFKLPWTESGHAWTGAVSWLPEDWLRVTAEVLNVDSTRIKRLVAHKLDPHQNDTQTQLSVRYYF